MTTRFHAIHKGQDRIFVLEKGVHKMLASLQHHVRTRDFFHTYRFTDEVRCRTILVLYQRRTSARKDTRRPQENFQVAQKQH